MKTAFSQLRATDLKIKGANFDREASELVAYYDDSARQITIATLEKLGMGIYDPGVMSHPPDLSLLRWIVQKLSVAYLRPPSRWLAEDSIRLPEDAIETITMRNVLERSEYDGAWQSIDETRALLRQAIVRIYAIDSVKRCALRVFGPQQVFRDPSDEVPSLIDRDKQFALRLSSNRFEHWTREGEIWRCQWVDGDGAVLDEQPFDGGVSPYAQLPVAIVYDSHVSGSAWLPLRTNRLGILKGLSAIAAELLQLIRLQGHGQRVFSGVLPNEMPRERGPETDIVLTDPQAKGEILNPAPQIDSALLVAKQWLQWLMASEELPLDALQESKTILTGAALKVSQAGLIDRRERLSQVAKRAEPDLYARFRTVHNTHAKAWGVESLDDKSILEVQLAPLSFPASEIDVLEVGSRKIALGLASRVDLLCEIENVSRADAIKRLEQIDDDLETFPPPTRQTPEDLSGAGPRTRTAPDEVLDETSSASVIDAVAKQTQH